MIGGWIPQGIPTAAAFATTDKKFPDGWDRLPGVQAQKGDIIIYACKSGGAGHIAVYESDYVTYHQNYSGRFVERVDNGVYYKDARKSCCYYWGVIRPDFTNSRVAIDSVTEGKTYTARFSQSNIMDISGWAMTDVENAFVQMYVDNTLAVAAHNISRYDRPGVSSNPNVGYTAYYDFGNLSEGTHTLKVVCHEPTNGNNLAQKTVDFNVIHADMVIDSIKDGDSFEKGNDIANNQMRIYGWSATKKDSFVQMYVDDQLAVSAHLITRIQRDDIVGYDKAGYEAYFNYSDLSIGEHTLKVITFEEGINQVLISEQVTFNIVEKDILLGDVNNDGKVNIKDWNIVYNHINETSKLTDEKFERADVNKDGKVNIKDWNRMYDHITEVNPLW